jgi:hypothetical protein
VKFIGAIALGVAAGCWYVYVAWTIWFWFAVPLGAPAIGYWHAFGLYSLATSVLIWCASGKGEADLSEVAAVMLGKAFLAAFILGEAWVALKLMGAA